MAKQEKIPFRRGIIKKSTLFNLTCLKEELIYNHGGRKMIEGDILFSEDIARLFHISANTIRRKKWREKSGIPLRRVGKHLCGLKSELEKWFKGLN